MAFPWTACASGSSGGLAVSGKAGSTLDLTATCATCRPMSPPSLDPSLAADGVDRGGCAPDRNDRSTGGTIKVTADRMGSAAGRGAGAAAGKFAANAVLQGTSARIDTRLTAGPSHVTVNGTAPLSSTGALDLKPEGQVDLKMLDPLLLAQGRRARGEVDLNAEVTGTTPRRINGTANLRNGDVTDFALGAHVSDLAATMQANGDTIRLSSFTGKAGTGTLGGSGTISLAATMPIDLQFTANDARPVAGDLVTALIDANLTVQGRVKGELQAGGTLHVRRADIRIPDKLPPSIAVLPVRDANAPPPPSARRPRNPISR